MGKKSNKQRQTNTQPQSPTPPQQVHSEVKAAVDSTSFPLPQSARPVTEFDLFDKRIVHRSPTKKRSSSPKKKEQPIHAVSKDILNSLASNPAVLSWFNADITDITPSLPKKPSLKVQDGVETDTSSPTTTAQYYSSDKSTSSPLCNTFDTQSVGEINAFAEDITRALHVSLAGEDLHGIDQQNELVTTLKGMNEEQKYEFIVQSYEQEIATDVEPQEMQEKDQQQAGLAERRIDSKFEDLDKLAENEEQNTIKQVDPLITEDHDTYDDPEDIPLEEIQSIPAFSDVQAPETPISESYVVINIPDLKPQEAEMVKHSFTSRLTSYSVPFLRSVTRTLKPVIDRVNASRPMKAISQVVLITVCMFIWPLVASGALAYKMTPAEAKRKLDVFFTRIWRDEPIC